MHRPPLVRFEIRLDAPKSSARPSQRRRRRAPSRCRAWIRSSQYSTTRARSQPRQGATQRALSFAADSTRGHDTPALLGALFYRRPHLIGAAYLRAPPHRRSPSPPDLAVRAPALAPCVPAVAVYIELVRAPWRCPGRMPASLCPSHSRLPSRRAAACGLLPQRSRGSSVDR